MSADAPHSRLPYLLSTIRIGIICTVIILVPIATYPFAARVDALTHPGLYWTTLFVGLAGAGIVALLPWDRMFARGWGYPGLYLWSIGDITLISLLVYASGGAPSTLWSVYALTTIFFAASYPRRSQYALFGFTVVSYLAVIAAVDPAHVTADAGVLVLRLGLLATVAIMAGFISSELFGRMAAQERRAQASQAIAEAAGQMGSLDREKVIDAAIRAADATGFPMSAVVMVEGGTYRIVAASGVPESFERFGLTTEAVPTGEVWVMQRDEIEDPEAAQLLEQHGCSAVVLAPLQVGGRTVGTFAACGRGDASEVEAAQILATVVSGALENAELYRLKSDFVANVSHELRTPLTVLAGLGETLRRRAGEMEREVIGQLAERMEGNAERLDTMITALLDFADLESRDRRTRDELDVADLVEETVRSRRDRLSPREVVVDVPRGARATGDREMLRRAIVNLLDNVADHTPPETRAEISVTMRPDEVLVIVADDGPGLPPEEADRATERFFRGGDHRTRRSRGLGLGLSLAREIVVLHGGRLEIGPSELGGTAVTIRLPRI